MFEGLQDMFDKTTSSKGFRTLKYVEEKLLYYFENDDRNPYFEAVYVAMYSYYHIES